MKESSDLHHLSEFNRKVKVLYIKTKNITSQSNKTNKKERKRKTGNNDN